MKRLSGRRGYKVTLGDLGQYDGPPIDQDEVGERLEQNARDGSAKLLAALLKMGLAA